MNLNLNRNNKEQLEEWIWAQPPWVYLQALSSTSPYRSHAMQLGEKKSDIAGAAKREVVSPRQASCAERHADSTSHPVPIGLQHTAPPHLSESKARWPACCKLLARLSSPHKRSMSCKIIFQFKLLVWLAGLFIIHLLVNGIHCCHLHLLYTYPKSSRSGKCALNM